MASNTIYVSGKAKWARVYPQQMDTAFNAERFHITVYPDEASLVTLKASGSRVKEHADEDGKYYKFSRDNKKKFKDKVEELGPPKVIDADGSLFIENIGNGSTVTAKLVVFDSAFGKGTRLEAIRVDNHVPYDGQGGIGEDEPF